MVFYKKIGFWLLAGLGIVAGLLVIRNYFKSIDVTVYEITKKDLVITVSAISTGTIKADNEVRLTAQRVGRIAILPVEEGSVLRKGDLVAELEYNETLQRLQMEYVDLYQIHRWDYETHIEETMEALNDVVRAGKARYIGASSMFAWQFSKAQHTAENHGWSRFVSMQNHYNLVYREEEREMIPLCVDQGVGLIPWSPMARGFLAGKWKRDGDGETARARSDAFGRNLYFRDEDYAVADRVAEVARERGVSGSQIALAWILNKPYVASPIIGATRMDHLDQAISALEIKLSEEEMKKLEEPYRPHPVLGHA